MHYGHLSGIHSSFYFNQNCARISSSQLSSRPPAQSVGRRERQRDHGLNKLRAHYRRISGQEATNTGQRETRAQAAPFRHVKITSGKAISSYQNARGRHPQSDPGVPSALALAASHLPLPAMCSVFYRPASPLWRSARGTPGLWLAGTVHRQWTACSSPRRILIAHSQGSTAPARRAAGHGIPIAGWSEVMGGGWKQNAGCECFPTSVEKANLRGLWRRRQTPHGMAWVLPPGNLAHAEVAEDRHRPATCVLSLCTARSANIMSGG
ncbi:hypothetical protein OH76DRAFT_286588 [Lentinus brumalis]|uniref:Uncharacterized protein n=1 Tax=Lentinus brumalis TaxID=2498619 RepID=A0A371CKN2_9APHY|nr:hypothetical protein OH76DRAFT_286588 [Polyporus brumalis]